MPDDSNLIQSSTDLVDRLRSQLHAETINISSDRFAITSLSKIRTQFRSQSQDVQYSDVVIIAQTSGVGSRYCYCEDPIVPTNILGTDARYSRTGIRCIDIATLDAAYSDLLPHPDIFCRLEGTLAQKAEARASLLMSEIQRLVKKANLDHPHITVVGAVENILSSLVHYADKVYATDLDPTLIGTRLAGIVVEDGHAMTLKRISQSHFAVVTGMTLATDTLSDILNIARLHDVRIVMYAQTGANFAGRYLEWGVDCVVCEEFPFYMFPGSTKLRVFRRSQGLAPSV